jgi:hypothetical protein
MRVIFYSEQCEYSKKLLAYIEKNNIKNIFKLVNIDTTEVSDEIDIVPTIFDTELNQPMKGKKAFEYLLNLKFFNNPTNNIEYIKELPPNPNIPEDDKAVKSKSLNLELGSTNTTKVSTDTIINDLFNNVSKSITLESVATNESRKFHESNINKTVDKAAHEMVNHINVLDNKLAILMKMKRK